jgi:hypothetical protein
MPVAKHMIGVQSDRMLASYGRAPGGDHGAVVSSGGLIWLNIFNKKRS